MIYNISIEPVHHWAILPEKWKFEHLIGPSAHLFVLSAQSPQVQSYIPISLCLCLGFGRLVTHWCGHIRILLGWSSPSMNFVIVSERCTPPRGVFGNPLGGRRERQ